MRNILYSFLLLFTLMSCHSFAGTLSAENNAQFALNQASPGAMASKQLGTIVIKNQVRMLKATYDFSVLGGTGTMTLRGANGKPVVLPNKAIVTDCLIDVATPLTTSSSATLSVGTGQGTADLKALTAAASYTGLVACIPVGTAASAIKLTADRTVTVTTAVGTITAGKFNVLIQFVISE